MSRPGQNSSARDAPARRSRQELSAAGNPPRCHNRCVLRAAKVPPRQPTASSLLLTHNNHVYAVRIVGDVAEVRQSRPADGRAAPRLQRRVYSQRLRDLAELERRVRQEGRDDLVLLIKGAVPHTEVDITWLDAYLEELANLEPYRPEP